ncbi:MAG: sensor histidine kinase [Campylobacterales bacterium]|nr:sensor histidine kinase [Campylobacterales bacterium]
MRNISIEIKIIISVIFFTLFVVSLERYQLSKNIIEQFIESKKSKNSLLIDTIIPVIALNISLGLESTNKEYLEKIVEQNSDLEFIELQDSKKRIIFSYSRISMNELKKSQHNINFCGKDIMDSISGDHLGHVDLHFSNDDYQLVLSKNRDTTIKIFSITLILLILFVFFIKKEFKNLKELSENVLSYDPKLNNFTLSASERFDEVGIIHNAIVSMVARIHSHSKLLDETNALLEIKVQERTETLDSKNKLLFAEIKNKNVLLRELYHRVKNNLQIISSLLSLQSRRIQDKTTKSIFDETNQRIKAMALIHEKLYQSNDLEAVDMQIYTLDLVDNLRQSFQTNTLTFEIVCENFRLDLERAVPMGLIINEAVTNAIKYAFDDTQKNKTIGVKMYKAPNDKFLLEVYDNGKGADLQAVHQGFGFKLIESLASYQLKGIICPFNENGLHIQIIFSREILK